MTILSIFTEDGLRLGHLSRLVAIGSRCLGCKVTHYCRKTSQNVSKYNKRVEKSKKNNHFSYFHQLYTHNIHHFHTQNDPERYNV